MQNFQSGKARIYISFYRVHGLVMSLSRCAHICSADRPIKRAYSALSAPYVSDYLLVRHACTRFKFARSLLRRAKLRKPLHPPPCTFWKKIEQATWCKCLSWEWMLQYTMQSLCWITLIFSKKRYRPAHGARASQLVGGVGYNVKCPRSVSWGREKDTNKRGTT